MSPLLGAPGSAVLAHPVSILLVGGPAIWLAVMVVLVLTLLRPGWTMSAEQRRALRVGETVIRTYAEAGEGERAEIRRVMGWRAPEKRDSASGPRRVR